MKNFQNRVGLGQEVLSGRYGFGWVSAVFKEVADADI